MLGISRSITPLALFLRGKPVGFSTGIRLESGAMYGAYNDTMGWLESSGPHYG